MLHSICQLIWKIQQWLQDWKRSVFIPIPKKSSAKDCSNYCTIVLISRASKVMLGILQASLQQYVNWKLPDIQAGFRKGRGTRDPIANIHWIIKKAECLRIDAFELWCWKRFLRVPWTERRSNCQHTLDQKKAREFQKNIYFIDYAKSFSWVDYNKLWEILKEMGIPDDLTYLLRNLYVG